VSRSLRAPVRLGAIASIGGLVAAGLSTITGAPAQATDWSACLAGPSDRQAVFSRAAERSGVPQSILLGVSFMESRWDDHAGAPSTSAGYGPLHLTSPDGIERAPEEHPMGKGDGVRRPNPAPQVTRERIGKDALSTLAKASALTGISESRLKKNAVANVCGGAAVLAQYQHEAGGARDLGDWSAAVARYSGADDQATAVRFAKQVFKVIRTGKARTTNDGQRMVLRPTASARVDLHAVQRLDLPVAGTGAADCPAGLACEWLPSPYKHFSASPGDYGHYDLADRPNTGNIDYIVMHDTEATWDTTLQLINTPEYAASWHYTIRSADGYIAQHIGADDVAWQAGNWYVNMHSIGIEQEGFAADGATWYTESLYQNSARLVRHLAREYGVTIDRAHIIGHDQVPGTTPGTVAGMHWDPGPYWNWEHYFQLLGHPINPSPRPDSTVVTVKPGFQHNEQLVTHCDDSATTDDTCPTQGTNFVYLYSQPDLASPLVTDLGLKPTGAPSTTIVSDIGARAAAGQQLVVQEVLGDWTKVWWLGADAWVYNRQTARTLIKSQGQVVTPVAAAAVPVYGRAYPEASAYPAGTTPQSVVPLQYTIKPGQQYVLADADIETDYYKATTFNCSVQPDCLQIQGADKYYEIWFGHRIAYVRAADVTIKDGVATAS
jgi:N-acetyl-anhydromuramyl-L-alanine amidase AmpD